MKRPSGVKRRARPAPRDSTGSPGQKLTAASALERLQAVASPEIAAHSARFFKTGPGQYGAGDVFIGVRVPQLRLLAREFRTLPLGQTTQLLQSEIHEARLLALLILVLAFPKADDAGQREIYDAYLAHARWVNNWDLVDSSAPYLVGAYLLERSRRPLYPLAKSANLWERRISILATQTFIRADDFADTLQIAELLLADKEDLIHKAVGWMLREAGKRDIGVLRQFLDRHAARMPRTMLRYAIERLPAAERQRYLAAKP